MRKFSYYSIVAFVSFIIGICGVGFWLFFDDFSLKNSSTEENVNTLERTNTELSQNNNFDLPSNSQESTSLPCSRLGADPSKPWEHISKVLDSFPPDNPLPKFVGTFQDKNWNYRLDLYRDSKGVFGEISSPVLEADSPTSQLYEVSFNTTNGSLQFIAQFHDENLQFSGFLHSKFVKGKFTQNGQTKTVTLKKLREIDEFPYESRAEFDCAMKLFGRY